LLVVFYKTKKALRAGLLTFFSNRFGDGCLIGCVCFLGGVSRYKARDLINEEWATVSARLVMVLASMTKSAQLPFRAWLPAAIAAPTPVSALVHSSTLVTAGCFMLIRFAGGIRSE